MSYLGFIVRQIKEAPIARRVYRHYTEHKVARTYKNRDPQDVFKEIATHAKWSGIDSISGPGSDLSQAQRLITVVPQILYRTGAKVFPDLPCGDHHWMKEVPLSGFHYIGGDIVPDLIQRNQKMHGSSSREFRILDLTTDTLPPADLILVRDCLVHLNFRSIRRALENLNRSSIRYLLTTTFPRTRHNCDVTTGNWRPLNLQRPPFNLPPPIELLVEGCTESYGQYSDKALGLWHMNALRESKYASGTDHQSST